MKKIREKFPIYRKYPNLKYFDTAASSLVVEDAIDAELSYYQTNGTNVHRGVYFLSNEATTLYENARSDVAAFINALVEEIVFTRGTSDSLNMVARLLANKIDSKSEIITSQLEHHSSILPWVEIARSKKANVKYIPLTKEGKIEVSNFKKVINKNTKVVVLTLMSNALGYITPIEEVVKIAKEYNALVIVDAAQAIAHNKVDVKKIGCDFLAFSGHKIYGPSGIGILYGRKEVLDSLYPETFGGEMIYKIYPDHNEFKSTPYKFETGTPPIAQAIALGSAIKFITNLGYDKISKHEMALYQYTLAEMLKIKGLTIYNETSESPLISFNIDGIHPHDVSSYLDSYQICIRAGHHCSQYVMNFLEVDATCRISFGVYNTREDCDELIRVVKEAAEFFQSF